MATTEAITQVASTEVVDITAEPEIEITAVPTLAVYDAVVQKTLAPTLEITPTPKIEVIATEVTAEPVDPQLELAAGFAVDRNHPITEEDIAIIETEELVPLADYPQINVVGGNVSVNQYIVADLEALMADAKAAGLSLYVKGGFRSFWQRQVALDKVNGDTTRVQMPGYSQHHTGAAIDFSTSRNGHAIGLGSGFENTPEGKWLLENGWKYGFVHPYMYGHDDINPNAEWHHMLWVGPAVAERLHNLHEQGHQTDIFDLLLSSLGEY